MSRLRVILLLAICALPSLPAVAGEPLPPASQWLSPETVAVLEVTRPEALLDLVLHPKLMDAVTSSPAYKQQEKTEQFKELQRHRENIEEFLERDWQPAVRELLGGGVTVAVGPQETAVLMVDAQNADILKDIHKLALIIARQSAAEAGEPDRVVSAEYRGVKCWTFGPQESHAIIGNRLVVTNRPKELTAILDRQAQAGGPSLANSPAYQRAKRAIGDQTAAHIYANAAVLKQVPGIKKALEGQENPLAVLLLAGVLESLREANWMTLGLDVQDDTFTLALATDGNPKTESGAAAFTMPQDPGDGAMPNLDVPRRIAAASMYRDLHGFYAAKDDLFPERTSELIFFENMMGIFFTGRDLTEEVLAETDPDVRLVVAGQQYDPEIGTPAVQVPAFAMVLRMKNPKKFKPIMEEAWQKAIGLVNFTRGQQAQPGLIIDRPNHGDTTYTVASFAATDETEDTTAVDMRFNFQPTLAMPGEFIILSSTGALAKDLIDALQKETDGPVKPLATTHSVIEVDGQQLAGILSANRESLIRNNMLEEGNTREQAETAINMLLMVAERVGDMKLDMAANDQQSGAKLQLQLNLE
jgi:hypothetical protein